MSTIVATAYTNCHLEDFACFDQTRIDFFIPALIAQSLYYILDLVFGLFAMYVILHPISRKIENAAVRGKSVRIMVFLLGWVFNLVLIFAFMVTYVFVAVANSLVLSLLGVTIAVQYLMCVRFTDVLGLMLDIRVMQQQSLVDIR